MMIGASASKEYGVWWFRIGRFCAFLRAPCNRPLFSERYGPWWNKLPLGFGWRVGFRFDLYK